MPNAPPLNTLVSPSAVRGATETGPAMHGPHILVLPPPKFAIEVPAHETVDVDKGVPVDDDATYRFADGHEFAPLSIFSMELDAGDPAIRGVALDPSLALGQSDRAS